MNAKYINTHPNVCKSKEQPDRPPAVTHAVVPVVPMFEEVACGDALLVALLVFLLLGELVCTSIV